MPLPSHANAAGPVSTRRLLAVGAIAAVGFALVFGAARLDVASIAVPQELLLRTAQLGLAAPAAQAAPVATEAGYLPAQIAVQGQAVEAHLPQF